MSELGFNVPPTTRSYEDGVLARINSFVYKRPFVIKISSYTDLSVSIPVYVIDTNVLTLRFIVRMAFDC